MESKKKEEIEQEVEETLDESCQCNHEECEHETCECEHEGKKKQKQGAICDKHEKGKHKKCDDSQEVINQLNEEISLLKNDYAKAYADTENMRKRLQSEFDQAKKYRIQSFALDILPIIDNMERALEAPVTEETDSYHKGVEMIYNQLIHALGKEGVEEIQAEGLPFDANFHQALMTEHVDGVEPGMVTQVLQKGYKLKDRILRASMVKVSE